MTCVRIESTQVIAGVRSASSAVIPLNQWDGGLLCSPLELARVNVSPTGSYTLPAVQGVLLPQCPCSWRWRLGYFEVPQACLKVAEAVRSSHGAGQEQYGEACCSGGGGAGADLERCSSFVTSLPRWFSRPALSSCNQA